MTVYITRDLPRSSRFMRVLTARGHRVVARSMLAFEAVAFDTLPASDWLFFYSPRGVRYFFEQCQELPPVKIGTLGRRTAMAVRQAGHEVHFAGSGVPMEAARKFREQLGPDETVCFVRAETSIGSMQSTLPLEQQRELIVYKSIPNPYRVPRVNLLVFTSPMNYQVFLEKNQVNARHTVIAIGPTTAAAIGDRCNAVAPTPDERTLLDVVLSFEPKPRDSDGFPPNRRP